eukprot:4346082-Pleurochrysis_carterae.AAC.1
MCFPHHPLRLLFCIAPHLLKAPLLRDQVVVAGPLQPPKKLLLSATVAMVPARDVSLVAEVHATSAMHASLHCMNSDFFMPAAISNSA